MFKNIVTAEPEDAVHSFSDDYDCQTSTFTLPCFIVVAVVVLAATYLEVLPGGMIGALPLMMVLGAVLDVIGNRTPLVKDYFGGGPIAIIFGSAALITTWNLPQSGQQVSILPDSSREIIQHFMREQGFLDFYIASLITGSILGMDRSLLIRAAVRYIPVIMAGLLAAILLTGITGSLLGYGFQKALLYIAIPIMGGGMGAGAVPLAEMFGQALDAEPREILSTMVPAVALGNALAIVCAGILDKVGRKRKTLTGNGRLLKGYAAEKVTEKRGSTDFVALGHGLLVATSFMLLGEILSTRIDLHPYALMILSVAAAKVIGIVPSPLEQSTAQWSSFVVKVFTPALLVGIGVAYTDLHAVREAITPVYVALVLTTILGAVLGSGIASHILGFYVVEGSITAGLCMANMGGTGDVAVLSAAHRMELIPFAQISSRIGGAFILILTSVLLKLIG